MGTCHGMHQKWLLAPICACGPGLIRGLPPPAELRPPAAFGECGPPRTSLSAAATSSGRHWRSTRARVAEFTEADAGDLGWILTQFVELPQMPAFIRDWTVRSGMVQTAAAISDGKLPLEVQAQLLDALHDGGMPGQDLVARMAASLAPHASLGLLEEEPTAEVLKGSIVLLMARTGLLEGLARGTVKVAAAEGRLPAASAVEQLRGKESRKALAKRLARRVDVPLVIVRAIVNSLSSAIPRVVPVGALDFAISQGRVEEVEERLVNLLAARLSGKFLTPEQTRPAVSRVVHDWLDVIQRRPKGLPGAGGKLAQPPLPGPLRRLGNSGSRLLGGLSLLLRGREPDAADRGGGSGGVGGGKGGGGRGGGRGGEPPSGDAAEGAGGPEPQRAIAAWPALAALFAAVFLVLVATVFRRREVEAVPQVKRRKLKVSRSDLYIGISAAALVEVLLLLFGTSPAARFLQRLLGLRDEGPEGDPETWEVNPEVSLNATSCWCGGRTAEEVHRERAIMAIVVGAGCCVVLALCRRQRSWRPDGLREPDFTPFEFLAELRPWLVTSGLPNESAKTLAAAALFAHSLASETTVAPGTRMSRPCALVICSPDGLSRVAAIQRESHSTITTRYDVPKLSIWQLCDWQRLQDCLLHDGECLFLRPNGSLHAILQQSEEQTAEMWKGCSARAGASAVLLESPGSSSGARVVVLSGQSLWQSRRVAPPPRPPQEPAGPGGVLPQSLRESGGSVYRPSAHMMIAAALHSVDEFVVSVP
mmetsp:Transcript_63625/g.201106  ORF Transcript_63625/g.201106 Transcript_63625/m.201106 type:complete len:762 (+) Transcript_63625:40-2325(+)